MNDFSVLDLIVQAETLVVGIDGKRGAGKTNFAVYLVKNLQEMTQRNVYANIHLKKIKYKTFTKEMLKTLPSELDNSIILIDELHVWGDSYKFLSKQSEELTLLFTQLRKRNIILIHTTQQFEGQIAIRLRRNTDYLLHCTNTKRNYPVYYNHGITCLVTVSEINDLDGEPYSPFTGFAFKGKEYWKYYNTKEIVLS